MTRQEHLDWCKQRTLEYVNNGDLTNAITSMVSDVVKHPETKTHIGIELGMKLSFGGFMNSTDEVKKWIEGFN